MAEKGDYVLVRVRVTPRAAQDALLPPREGMVCIALTAAPHDGEANEALCAFLSKRLGVAKRRVVLIRGEKSREKTVRIDGVSAARMCEVLGGS